MSKEEKIQAEREAMKHSEAENLLSYLYYSYARWDKTVYNLKELKRRQERKQEKGYQVEKRKVSFLDLLVPRIKSEIYHSFYRLMQGVFS